jgi:DNA polymerase delta subunit 2
LLPKGEKKHYAQQFADLYFLRLAILKPDIEKIAREAWANFEVTSNPAQRAELASVETLSPLGS